ncbi:Brix domain-containing protein [Phyllosticta capitalensis]
MALPLREIKPKSVKTKRALEKRAPQVHENPKTTLFLRGTSCSQIAQLALTDLKSLKDPLAIKFNKKNDIHPFEDASSLEFFSEKNDASLMVFAHHSKKRPHALTFLRFFNWKVLDILELYVDPESFRELKQFKNKKAAVGLKPMLSFSGSLFDSPTQNAYTQAKSYFSDFFRGGDAQNVDVEGLQYMIHFSVAGEEVEGQAKPVIKMRVYLIKTKKSGQKLPRVEVEEMGPRIDFRVGRIREADEAIMKEALKRPKQLEPKTKKNIETDMMGDKIGRIHVGKQDLDQMQTRKMKGLKRRRDEDGDDETMIDGDSEDEISFDEDEEEDEEDVDEDMMPDTHPKRERL